MFLSDNACQRCVWLKKFAFYYRRNAGGNTSRNFEKKDERIGKASYWARTVNSNKALFMGEKDSEGRLALHSSRVVINRIVGYQKRESLFRARDSPFGTYSRVILDFDETISNAPVYSFQICDVSVFEQPIRYRYFTGMKPQ